MSTTSAAATMTLVTRDPLEAGREQSLAIRITTRGFESLYVSVPHGDSEDALMMEDQFTESLFKIPDSRRNGIATHEIDPRTGNMFYRIGFSVGGTKQEQQFTLSIEKFLVEKHAGVACLALYGDDVSEPPLARVQVAKTEMPAKIEFFVADRYSVEAGRAAVLKWKMNIECDYEVIHHGEADKVLDSDRGKGGSLTTKNKGEYTLNLRICERVVDSRSLRIHSFSKTKFGNYDLNLGENGRAEILSLHANPDRGRLYALARFKASDEEAQLWWTTNGFDSKDYSSWQPEKDHSGNVIVVPVEAARRPGAVMWDKLWLMGGDCCHPDKPGSDIGYYDFQKNTWEDKFPDNDSVLWPKIMTERMGHAVVAVPFGRSMGSVWVLGGWSQNGGLCNDIWEFDGNGWSKLNNLSCEACLFGATATQNAVWTFGGFLSPGGVNSKSELQRYSQNSDRFEISAPTTGSILKGGLYSAAALFDLEEKAALPRGVCNYCSEDGTHNKVVFSILEERGEFSYDPYTNQLNADGVFLGYDFYHIQATVFQGVAFFRNLRPDFKDAYSAIHYLVQFPKEG